MTRALLLFALLGAWNISVPEKTAYVVTWTVCERSGYCADTTPDTCGCSRDVMELENKERLDGFLSNAPPGWRDVRVYQVAKTFRVETSSRLVP